MSGSFQGSRFPAGLAPRPGWFTALGILLGVLAWADVVAATLASTMVVGLMLIVAEVLQIAHASAHRGLTASAAIVSGLIGILYVLGGVTIIAEPVAGSVLLTAVLAFCLVLAGVFRMAWDAGHRRLAGGSCCSAGRSPWWSAC